MLPIKRKAKRRILSRIFAGDLLAAEGGEILSSEAGELLSQGQNSNGNNRATLVYLQDTNLVTRSFIKEVPKGVNKGIAIFLPGGGGTAASIRGALNFDQQLKDDYVCAYINGRFNPTLGLSTLNAGPFFTFSGAAPAEGQPDYLNSSDDVDLINKVVNKIVATENVDPNNIIIIGISNGTMMAYRYASRAFTLNFTYKPRLIYGISGVITQDTGTEPFSYTGELYIVNGTNDNVVTPAGDANYMSQAASNAIILAANPTATIRTVVGIHSLDSINSGLKNESPSTTLYEVLLSII